MKCLTMLLFGVLCCAQPRELQVWADVFGTHRGVVFYPQYAWKYGSFNGFGFAEVAPGEKMFVNNLVVYTPKQIPWFSVHTETGGYPVHSQGFFQLGPRVNVLKIFPRLSKPFANVFIAPLPRFIGIRPNNVLIAGSTKPFRLSGVVLWGEGYRRIFSQGPAYGEYWFLASKKQSPFSVGLFIHDHGGNRYVGCGVRYKFFSVVH